MGEISGTSFLLPMRLAFEMKHYVVYTKKTSDPVRVVVCGWVNNKVQTARVADPNHPPLVLSMRGAFTVARQVMLHPEYSQVTISRIE